jgi:phosphatidylglycerol:prolipoprotein diacylglycerol transferase
VYVYPIILKIGPVCIYSYGLMVAIAFAAAISLSYRYAPRFGIDRESVVDFGISILLGGIAGARLFYVLLNLAYYKANPAEIFDLTKGGLVWYGGFLAGVVVAIVFVKVNRIDFFNGADLLAPFIALAQGIGRIGCLLNGCCYGIRAPEGFPLGVKFPQDGVLRHPAQLYEAAALFAIFVFLIVLQRSRRFKGEIFLAYAILYSVARFLLEYARGDNFKAFAALTLSQLISAAIFVVCSVITAIKYIQWKKNSSGSA